MASDNVPNTESSNKDVVESKDPVFPVGIDDPLIYEAFHPAGPDDANKPLSPIRAAGQVIEDAVQGAINTAVDEAKNHPGRFALETGGAIALGVAATASSPIIAGGAALVGAGEATVAGAAAVGTAVEGLAAMTLGVGTIKGGVAAVNDTKEGLDKSQKDIEIVTHPEKHTPEEIAQANKNIETNLGPGALEAILTTGVAPVVRGNFARLIGKATADETITALKAGVTKAAAQTKEVAQQVAQNTLPHDLLPQPILVTGGGATLHPVDLTKPPASQVVAKLEDTTMLTQGKSTPGEGTSGTTDHDIAAAKEHLTNSLSHGNIDGAEKVLDLNLLNETDLRAPEIRQAAQTTLTRLVSGGHTVGAKRILDFKLLNEADLRTPEIRQAAQTRLTRSLSRGRTADVQQVLDLKLLGQNEIDSALQQTVQAGNVTSAVRFSLERRVDLDTTLKHYLDIPELTDESAATLFDKLKTSDPAWKDVQNVQAPFESGAREFGAARMLRYVFKANSSPHDALHNFDNVVKLYKKSGFTPNQFDGNILAQVNRDDALDDTGSSFSRLNAIANSFPHSVDKVLEKARQYPDVKTLQELTDRLKDTQSVFASWPNLQRFAKLQQFVENTELLPQLQQLRSTGQTQLADWVEALAFHPDSRVSAQAVKDFWQQPDRFLDIGEQHAPQSHELKKPIHYTDIPHGDLTPIQLRDALIDGTLDKLQVYSPMKVEYEVGSSKLDTTEELKRALGSRRESIPGEAKNPGKLFAEVNKLLKPNGFTVPQVLNGSAKLTPELEEQLNAALYNDEFGLARTQSGMRLVAQIHKKSDPLAVVAGDDTASCMGFGTGKNNVYMFNPNDALFTVRLVRPDGSSRTIAESVLTKDKDVKVDFPTLLQQVQANQTTQLHEIIPEAALSGSKSFIAADNVEVHPNYRGSAYASAIEAVYQDFFARYAKLHPDENLRDDKLIIGTGYSQTMQHLPKETNTYVPQAPLGYTDKSAGEVLVLPLTEQPKLQVNALSVETPGVEGRIKPQASIAPGVTPMTFEDTLSVAYLEGKAFQDNPSLQVGLHNMENALIAKDINNAAKSRPNLSLKYSDDEGRLNGYLLAYEGAENINGVDKPVIFISDFTRDRQVGPGAGIGSSTPAGRLLLQFGKLYTENYLDKGQMIPIYTNARSETSYRLLQRQMQSLGRRFGYQFEVQELSTHQDGSSLMHDVLITPHKE